MKNEFLTGLDGALSADERVLLLAATNLPEQLDQAALRRFQEKLLIPLPGPKARRAFLDSILPRHESSSGQKVQMSHGDLERLVAATAGFAGCDMAQLCREAAMAAIREFTVQRCDAQPSPGGQLRPMVLADFEAAQRKVKPANRDEDIERYRRWNADHGSWPNEEVFEA